MESKKEKQEARELDAPKTEAPKKSESRKAPTTQPHQATEEPKDRKQPPSTPPPPYVGPTNNEPHVGATISTLMSSPVEVVMPPLGEKWAAVPVPTVRVSEPCDKIVGALIRARMNIESVVKGETARVPTRKGGSYEYTYASLGDTLDACLGAVAAEDVLLTSGPGLDVLDNVVRDTERGGFERDVCGVIWVTTVALHASGQWAMVSVPMIPPDLYAQTVGSCLTYGRRYGIACLLQLATKDDDGAAAHYGHAATAQRRAAIAERTGLEDWQHVWTRVVDEATWDPAVTTKEGVRVGARLAFLERVTQTDAWNKAFPDAGVRESTEDMTDAQLHWLAGVLRSRFETTVDWVSSGEWAKRVETHTPEDDETPALT